MSNSNKVVKNKSRREEVCTKDRKQKKKVQPSTSEVCKKRRDATMRKSRYSRRVYQQRHVASVFKNNVEVRK
jgi:hypothetical protein